MTSLIAMLDVRGVMRESFFQITDPAPFERLGEAANAAIALFELTEVHKHQGLVAAQACEEPTLSQLSAASNEPGPLTQLPECIVDAGAGVEIECFAQAPLDELWCVTLSNVDRG